GHRPRRAVHRDGFAAGPGAAAAQHLQLAARPGRATAAPGAGVELPAGAAERAGGGAVVLGDALGPAGAVRVPGAGGARGPAVQVGRLRLCGQSPAKPHAAKRDWDMNFRTTALLLLLTAGGTAAYWYRGDLADRLGYAPPARPAEE